MRVMNGRLGNVVRNPLRIRNNYLDNGGEHKRLPKRRRDSSGECLPRPVQFDESAEQYRCFCGCFHVKTGAYLIAGIELFLILVFFLNALLVLLQQRNDLDRGNAWNSQYVQTAFIIESISLGLALGAVLLLLVGLGQNSAALLLPHLTIQVFALFCLFFLLEVGTVAVCTDLAVCYRLLNVAPFNEYPGQSTVALSAETMARVYVFLGLYFVSFLLECWFLRIIYNCNRYFSERRKYMRYCLAYSTPLKTLNSAR